MKNSCLLLGGVVGQERKMTAKIKEQEKRTKARILATLAENGDGLTISDISRILGNHYTTVSKYLAVMEAEKKVIRRDIGMAKVFKIK